MTPNWIKYRQSHLLDTSVDMYTTLENETSHLHKTIDAIPSYKEMFFEILQGFMG